MTVEKQKIFQQTKLQADARFLGFPRCFPQIVENLRCEKGNRFASFRFRTHIRKVSGKFVADAVDLVLESAVV